MILPSKYCTFYYIICAFILLSYTAGFSAPLKLVLPTDNKGIFEGKPEKFYMYVDRVTDGVSSKPWTGGKYGYWRTLRNTREGLLPTKFHEGVDIAPLYRDKAGRPLDLVSSIAKGKVVYTNSVSSRSSYGKYVIVQHNWGHGPFYSLYAHLASVNCSIGQKVNPGSTLGKLGYTGVGINLRRAHLHLELGIMLHTDFEKWHSLHHPKSKNYHNRHNGINISGLDIAALFIMHKTNPHITIPQFLKNTPVQYKVIVPRNKKMELPKFYPWLVTSNNTSPSWEISFSDSNFPLSISPSSRSCSAPILSYVKSQQMDQKYRTRYYIKGTSNNAHISSSGSRFIQLVTGAFLP